MKEAYTHIAFVLDASGSMNDLAPSFRQQFAAWLADLRREPGQTVLDVFQYSDQVEHLVRAADISQVSDDLLDAWHCEGHTALNDAICIAVDTLGVYFNRMSKTDRPDRVFIIIVGDGIENASRQYSQQNVRDRVLHQTLIYSWQFLIATVGLDVHQLAAPIGITAENSASFEVSRIEAMFDFLRNRLSLQ